MYYMRKIAEYKTGTQYTGRKSSNKYLKDWHTADTGNTPSEHKYNLWYLRRIAQVYDPEFDMTSNENQCLQTILERISSTTTVRLTLSSNNVLVDDEITMTALVLDENREPIKDATVTFTDGTTSTTATTGNDGKASTTYSASTVGEIILTATYDEYSSNNTLTVNKHTSSINMSAVSTEVYMGKKVTLNGYLLIDGVGASGKSIDVCVLTDIGTWYVYDTITSTTDGAYTYNDFIFGDSEGIVTYMMRYNGDTKTDGSSSNSIAINVTKIPTTLTINTPTIVYSDEFSVTGTLTRADDNPMIDIPVTLNWRDNDGNSGTATTRTDFNGQVTFSRSEPTTITQYTFQLVYNGFQDLKPSQSAQINVDVNKETAVLNITSPQTGASVSQADSITVEGTLKDNDDEILDGMKVYAKLGGTTLETFTVDNTGAISGTLYASDLNTGANNIEFIFYDTTEYTRSTQEVIVNKGITYTKLEVEATNPILSYADSESTDMTAQLLDNSDNPVALSGVTLYFRDGATTLGSAQTDATGKATLLNAYTSQGIGDVEITVDDGDLVTERYDVQDCIDTILGDTDQSSKFGSSISLRNSGTSSISYDSTNKQYIVDVTKANSESFIPINSADSLDDIVIEFDTQLPSYPVINALCFYKDINNWGRLGTVRTNSTSTKYEYAGNTNGTYAEADISGSTPPANTWLHHKFTITNDTVHRQVYNGETLIYEDTRTYTGFFTSTTKYGFTALWSTGWKGYYKNIKIKPL